MSSVAKPELSGRRVLVTGAGTGIGLGIALACGRAGANVVFHYASSSDGASSGAAEIASMGQRAKAIQADLARVSDCRRLVAEAAEFLGGLDALVNNAGLTLEKAFADTDEQDYDLVTHINLRGYFFCAQEAARIFVEKRKGVILNVTSGQALIGIENHAAYSLTKGGIVSFTRELAIELAPLRIRVNAIGPGLIEVPRIRNRRQSGTGVSGYDKERAAAAIPLRRVGTVEDCGNAAVFLLSDAADYVTGQVLYVDGGVTAQVPAAL